MHPVLPLLLVLLTTVPSAARAQSATGGQVTIYRCVAANGTVALRDSPCLKGEKQEVRAMQRPQDPPARPAAAPAPAPSQVAPAPPPERVVYLSPPKPMYECTTPEGRVYTSDNGDGNPRWVPYAVGYSTYPTWPRTSGGSVSGSVSIGNGNLSFESGDRRPPRPPGGGHHPGPVILPGGAWVRDACHPLPQNEVCARLSDRRYEILRRYGAALPSERRTLDLEQRGIDARMSNDCR